MNQACETGREETKFDERAGDARDQRFLHGPELTMENLCDRWNAHSKTCRHCRRAMEMSFSWLTRMKHLSLVSSVGILLATFYRNFGMFLITSLFSLGGIWGIQWLQR